MVRGTYVDDTKFKYFLFTNPITHHMGSHPLMLYLLICGLLTQTKIEVRSLIHFIWAKLSKNKCLFSETFHLLVINRLLCVQRNQISIRQSEILEHIHAQLIVYPLLFGYLIHHIKRSKNHFHFIWQNRRSCINQTNNLTSSSSRIGLMKNASCEYE